MGVFIGFGIGVIPKQEIFYRQVRVASREAYVVWQYNLVTHAQDELEPEPPAPGCASARAKGGWVVVVIPCSKKKSGDTLTLFK